MIRRLLLALAALCAAPALAQPVAVQSPDGRNIIAFTIDEGRATYSVQRNGETIIAPSPTGLSLDKLAFGNGSQVTGVERRTVDQKWKPVTGRASQVRDHFNEAVVHLVDAERQRRDIVLRAYDDGVALRTIIPVQSRTDGAAVGGEDTGFYFPSNYRCYGYNVARFGTGHEGEFDPIEARYIRDHSLYDLPLLCETGKAALLISESDLLDFPAMYLKGRGDGGLGVVTRLSPLVGNPGLAARTKAGEPIKTPWRVIMLADKAGRFAGSHLIDNLATPSRVADTSWIKPGKSASDWLSGGWVGGEAVPVSSLKSLKAFADFAGQNGFEYVMADDGWYFGSGTAPNFDPKADPFANAPNFNLQELIAHAGKQGVKVWVWVDWRAVDRDMEGVLSHLSKQGVVGINVDFMDRDDQEMVRWYEKLMAAAARHKLMVELHGAFVPRGLARTYPNFVTQEGVLGSEYNKWSRRVTAGHNLMIAYTRGMLGRTDYIPGNFINVAPRTFQIRSVLPMVQTTRAHQLSMFVVYDSPWTSLAESPDIYRSSPAGLDFIRVVPTSWDETRYVAGDVGQYLAIAKRKGDRWYVGAMNGDAASSAVLPLSFLGRGNWTAELWLDGASPDAIHRETRKVSANDTLDLDLAATGGAVAVFKRR